jgi:N6-L-threonylcarbamoyladenine synthase
MIRRAGEEGIQVAFPPVSLCTDNAAMVAALGASYLEMGRHDDLTLDADAGLGWHAA